MADFIAFDLELTRLAEARRQVRDRLTRKDTPADREHLAELTAELDARLDQRNRFTKRIAKRAEREATMIGQ